MGGRAVPEGLEAPREPMGGWPQYGTEWKLLKLPPGSEIQPAGGWLADGSVTARARGAASWLGLKGDWVPSVPGRALLELLGVGNQN